MSGFFGCISRRECVSDVFYGTDYHSHLGTKRAGMSFYDGTKFVRSIHSLENGYFRNKFEDELPRFGESKMGVGIISDSESQPITITSHLGRYSVVTVARIDNMAELTERLLKQRMHFAELSGSDINATELVAMLIGMGNTIKEGIEYAQSQIKGSCSMLVLTDYAIYAARDKFGRTPISIGKNDMGYVCASESSSYTNLGYSYVRDLGPGEIVQMSADGVREVTPPGCRKQICSFLWVYYGYPSAWYEGVNVENARYENGAAMARRDTDVDIDYASGIPDSGIGHAIGYANEKGVPYKRPFVKYTPTWPRSFTPANQEMRSLVAKMKLIPNRAMMDGKRVLFCDDSIVRGTQLQDNVDEMFNYGAKEVHMRIACPPLIYSCPFIGFSSSKGDLELLSRRVIKELEGDENKNLDKYATTGSPQYERMVEEIRKRFGLTSLKFNTLEILIEAIGLPKCKVCTHCFDGSSHF